METRWASEAAEDPWPEYPRPQLRRDRWSNLNGSWRYAILPKTAPAPDAGAWHGDIRVPFAVESRLSGVARRVSTDERLWYQRSFSVPQDWAGNRVLVHFGAVDFECAVWINGGLVGSHSGGFDPFYFDITDYLTADNTIAVAVTDPSSLGEQPRGKQPLKPQGIFYTPVTGIWQTVWLEPVPADTSIAELRLDPDPTDGTVTAEVVLSRPTTQPTLAIRITVSSHGRTVATTVARPDRRVRLPVETPRLWSPDDPHLYDVVAELVPVADPLPDSGAPRGSVAEADAFAAADVVGDALDRVAGYCAFRSISVATTRGSTQPQLMLNGSTEFHLGTLDQGWWPDGLHTPPSDAAMIFEIDYLRRAGFNTLRKHIKIEPARYYYHCDRLGILVWQDMPCAMAPAQFVASGDVSAAVVKSSTAVQFELELRRMISHLRCHPSIVMWVIHNEGWGQFDSERLSRWVADLDPSRLVNAASGWLDTGAGDVNDWHDYAPDPELPEPDPNRALVLGEYGGIGWPVDGHLWTADDATGAAADRHWGYQTYRDLATVRAAYEQKTAAVNRMRRQRGVSAAIYTQTTDVEGEVNGLLTYDRQVDKLNATWLAAQHATLLGADDTGEPCVTPQNP